MSFYSDMASTAHAMLVEFGAPAILTRSVPGAYDPTTGAPGAATVTSYTGTGAVFEYQQKDIDGTLIQYGDQRAYLSTVGIINPQTGDTLTFNGVAFQVIASRPLQPALVSVLFDCQLRGLRA